MYNGYSKIDTGSKRKTQKSISPIEFSGSSTFPQAPKPSKNTTTVMAEETSQIKNPKTQNSSSSSPDEKKDYDGGNYNGERFGLILGRSGSVPSSLASSVFVKRAFSIRKSSSVSERYCRIHDQHTVLASPVRDDVTGEDEVRTRRSMKKKQQIGGSIFKACKRLLGL